MKKLILLSASLMAASSIYASDGTIIITGSVSDNTCMIETGTNGNFAVNLPQVSKSSLSSVNETAGRTPFNITVSNCDGAQVATYFEAGTNLSSSTGNLVNNGGTAENVEIQLLGDNGGVINLASSDNTNGQENSQWVTLTDNNATLNYAAQYYATGAVTAGDVTTAVQYSIIYQ